MYQNNDGAIGYRWTSQAEADAFDAWEASAPYWIRAFEQNTLNLPQDWGKPPVGTQTVGIYFGLPLGVWPGDETKQWSTLPAHVEPNVWKVLPRLEALIDMKFVRDTAFKPKSNQIVFYQELMVGATGQGGDLTWGHRFGRVWFDTGRMDYIVKEDWAVTGGDASARLIAHELGHVLGLGHPHPYNATKTNTGSRTPLPPLDDNGLNTVMTYNIRGTALPKALKRRVTTRLLKASTTARWTLPRCNLPTARARRCAWATTPTRSMRVSPISSGTAWASTPSTAPCSMRP